MHVLRAAAMLVLFVLVSCGQPPVGASSSSTIAPTASAVRTDSNAPSLPSRVPGTFTLPTDADMHVFGADRGALVAFSTKEGLPPYASRIQRGEASTGAWKTVFEIDAALVGSGQVVAGRAALIEYREPFQGGGAYSEDFTIVDLSTGATTKVDRFALSAATYHGGGGGPRHPVGRIALGPAHVAWTRLVEGSAGAVTGELRVASLADTAHPKVVGSSAEWISPLALDAHRFLYALGGKLEDQLHLWDLDTGVDKVVVTGAMPVDQQASPMPGLNRAQLSGDWAIWLDVPRAGPGAFTVLNLVTGERRTIDAGGSSCSEPSAGTRYVTWYCSAGVVGILDAKTLEPAARPAGLGVVPIASEGGLIWFDLSTSPRSVVLYRPLP